MGVGAEVDDINDLCIGVSSSDVVEKSWGVLLGLVRNKKCSTGPTKTQT